MSKWTSDLKLPISKFAYISWILAIIFSLIILLIDWSNYPNNQVPPDPMLTLRKIAFFILVISAWIIVLWGCKYIVDHPVDGLNRLLPMLFAVDMVMFVLAGTYAIVYRYGIQQQTSPTDTETILYQISLGLMGVNIAMLQAFVQFGYTYNPRKSNVIRRNGSRTPRRARI